MALYTTPWLLLLLAILFFATGRKARDFTRPVRRTKKGQLGERLVTDLLARLSDDYYLVNDLVLGARGNVDHVLVGPCGVVVIETKRVRGHIGCDGYEWWQDYRPVRSYSKQVKAGALAVKDFIGMHFPSSKNPYVEAVVVFTDPLCQLELYRTQVTAVRYSELLAVILELARRRRLAPTLAYAIASRLAAVH